MSISPIQFLRQVKQEVKKVTWPTKKEVLRYGCNFGCHRYGVFLCGRRRFSLGRR